MSRKFEELKKIVPNLKVTNPQDLLSLNDLSINSFVKKELVSKLSSVVPISDVANNIVELGSVIKMIKDILTPEVIDIKPFVIKNLMKLEIKSSVNDHTRAYIKARLYESDGIKYNEATSENLVEIHRKGDLVFKGYIENIKTSVANKDYILEVEAVSQSIKLDDKKFVRSFQDTSMTYKQLLEAVFDGSNIQYIIESDVKSKTLEFPLVQYKETNWEFVKRVFSEKNLELLPNSTHNSVLIGVTKDAKKSKLWNKCISIKRNLNRFRQIKENQSPDIKLINIPEISLSTREVVLAGERVTLKPKYLDGGSYASSLAGKEYSVRNSSIRFENNEIQSHVELYTLEDFIPEIIVNSNIAGVCFTAEVLTCENSRIKVKFDFDDEQKENKAYLFPYISPYTAKDNTGIYFMPEKGDKVLVKFPDAYEKNAIVLSAIMTSNGKGEFDTKKLTAFDKKIYFQKEDIVIAAKDDKTFIKISEKDGISIESDKEIEIKSDGTTDISSEGDLNLCAQGQINMKVGASKVSMGNGVTSTKASKIDWTSNRGSVKGSRKISEGLGESGTTSCSGGDPIDMSTGNFYTDKIDLIIEGKNPLTFIRFFNAMGTWKGSLGNKWQHNFEISLAILTDRTITVTYSNGRTEDYKEKGNGTIDSITNPYNKLRRTERGWELYTKEKTKYQFDNNGRLCKIEKSSGETINFTYDREKLIRVASGDGYFDLEYRGKYLVKVSDMTGRSVEYTYFNNNLADIKDVDGNLWQIEYDKLNRIHKMYDGGGFLELENIYDGKDRVIVQYTADGHKSILEYDDVALETKYIERNGEVRIFRRDEKGRIFEREFYSGREKLVFSDNNEVSQYTDKMGNKYTYAYDSFGNIATETNPLGETTKYEYNEQGELLKLVNPDGSEYNYKYDTTGNLLGTIDPEGRLVLANYDEAGNMSNILFTDGAKTEFVYDKFGNIIELKDPDGNVTKYFYDKLNRVEKLTRPNGNEIFYEYTSSGKITRVKFGDNSSKELLYNERGFIAKEIDEAGYSISYEYNDSGNLSKRIDQEGNITSFEYDSLWNISKIIKPDGTELTYKYDISNLLSEFIDEEGYKELMKYDGNGNMIEYSDKNGNISKREYDALNRVVKVIAPNEEETEFAYTYSGKIQKVVDALKGTEEFEYNKVGELLSVKKNGKTINKYKYNNRGFLEKEIDGEENTTSYVYSPSGKLREIAYPDKTKESLSYDSNGNLSVFTDKNGAKTEYFYDSKDRLVKVTDPLGNSKLIEYNVNGTVKNMTDEVGGKTEYLYSPTGKLTGVIDAEGNKRTYVYDRVGNLSEIHSFNFQTQISKPQKEELITKYLYDKRGLLTKEINPLNLVKTYAYDGNGNLVASIDEENITAKYEYDAVNNLIKKEFDNEEVSKYDYDPLKRLTKVSTPQGVTKYQYDNFDRLKRVTELNDKVIEYTWKDNGLKDSITYPDGTKVKYKYKDGKLSSVYENENLNSKYFYNPQGYLERKELANGIKTQYQYDSLSRITKLDTFDPEEKLLDSFTYSYDKVGNKKTVEKLRDEKTSSYNYRYDKLNRIIKVTDQDKITESYSYDFQGNRIGREKKDSEGQILSNEKYYYDFQNKLNKVSGLQELLGEKISGDVKFDYDPRGNVTNITEGRKTLGHYEFNKENLLKTATNNKGETTEFKYDGLNRRIGLKVESPEKRVVKEYSYVNDATTPYNSILMRYEKDLKGNKPQTESYIHGFGLESKETTNTWGEKKKNYYSHNELGSITREYNQEGNTTNSYEYDLFGVPSFREDTHSYTSYTHDQNTGLMYAQARYYLPEVGRFISEDLWFGYLEIPLTLNRYIYCTDNPLKYIDRNGRWQTNIHLWETQRISNYTFDKYKLPELKKYSELIGEGCESIDSGLTSPLIIAKGPQSWHFNANGVGLTGTSKDSRMVHYEEKHKEAVKIWNNAENNYNNRENNLAYKLAVKINGKCKAEANWLESRNKARERAMTTLGQGLHPLQDIDAHIDYGEEKFGKLGDGIVIAHHTKEDINPYKSLAFDNPNYNISRDINGDLTGTLANPDSVGKFSKDIKGDNEYWKWESKAYENTVKSTEKAIEKFLKDTNQIKK